MSLMFISKLYWPFAVEIWLITALFFASISSSGAVEKKEIRPVLVLKTFCPKTDVVEAIENISM